MSLHGPHRVITPTRFISGFLPSDVHLCPMTVISSAHSTVFVPEKVAPQYAILCNILHIFDKCSHTNLLIPEFSGMVSYVPSVFSYLVSGPFTGTSSIYGLVICGISSLRIYVTSSWNIGTEFVHPIGNVTSLKAP